MADVIAEKLLVQIEADIGELLEDTRQGVDSAEGELKKFERSGKKAFDKTGKGAQGLTQAFGKLQAVAGAFVALLAANKVVGFFTSIGRSAVQANAQFETFTTQFETLLGSTAAAEQRLDELAQFGVETPFELPEIVEASRVLQVFGGDAIATGDSLRMIGDIAAGVNQPFADVALWAGRMYDAMQSGRPFGEASARLQEMGALSGQTRAELEKMQKEGASGAELWARFNELVGDKFAGNMERLSGTFQGMTSNLVDFRDNLIRIGGEPIFDAVSESTGEFLEIISDEQMQEAITNLARQLGEAAAMGLEFVSSGIFESLEEVEPETIQNLADSLEDAAAALNELLGTDVSVDLVGLIELFTVLIDTTTVIVNTFNTFRDAASPVVGALAFLKETILDLIFPIRQLLEGFEALNELSIALRGKPVVEFSRDMAEASETSSQAAQKAAEAQAEIAALSSQGVGFQAPTTPDTGDDMGIDEAVEEETDAAKEALDKLAIEFIDATEERQQAIEELEQEHGEEIIAIEQEFAEKRITAINEAKEAVKELEAETAEERRDILAKAREDLEKLEQETDDRLAEERESFQVDELRETEDHLKDMRRLRMRFISDLEDAVKNRDARAIVDLRKRFTEEQQTQTEDFETKQQRERGDQDRRLQQIREAEQTRAQEIIANRERDLMNLEETEARKRAKIEEGLRQEIEKLNLSEQEKLATEQTKFEERQAQLDEALAKRLEAVAKELSDEDEINREGAEQILNTLNEFFGVGGEVDELMEEFESRRSRRMSIEVEFEGRRGRSSDGGGSPGAGAGLGSNPGQITGFQHGGVAIARQPTMVRFGEVPELATFTPLAALGRQGQNSINTKRIEFDLKLSGSAPPGIRSGDRDQIAAVLVQALREAGAMRDEG